MDYLVVCAAALLVAALTLFSGFGVGTLLMPVFALFFPVEIAIAATAVVHLANNLFKLAVVGRYADWRVVALFALPAFLAAPVGSWLLLSFADGPSWRSYEIGPLSGEIEPVKLVIGLLIVSFAFFDLLPAFQGRAVAPRRYLPVGGALSGFFGGFSGHQGALRSAFLIKCGLERDAFIGTSAVCAVAVDLARLIVYGTGLWAGADLAGQPHLLGLVAAASAAALAGSLVAARLRKKVTIRFVQTLVGVMLIVVGLSLAAGLA